MIPEAAHFIAVDVGGTQIRAACYQGEERTPLTIQRTATHHPDQTPLERIIALVRSVWPERGAVRAVGLAAPGPIDPHKGIIYHAPNIPSWVNLPLRDELEQALHTPVAVGNDANLACLGEWRYGAGQGHADMIYLTISTGIGGGVITSGRLLLGAHGLAGEMGHITVVPGGPLCGCGQRGHLEALAAGPAIAAWVEQEIAGGVPSCLPPGEKLTARMVGEAAAAGDELCTAAIARAGAFIGRALADFSHIFNPSIIVLGGGVSRTGPLLLDPLWSALTDGVISPSYTDGLVLTTAALGDEAGLTGALALAQAFAEELP
jgi:glucokinase